MKITLNAQCKIGILFKSTLIIIITKGTVFISRGLKTLSLKMLSTVMITVFLRKPKLRPKVDLTCLSTSDVYKAMLGSIFCLLRKY